MEEEIRFLRRELGIRRQAGELGAVMVRFGMTEYQARIALDLYVAGGRPVTREHLSRHVRGLTAENTISVHVLRVRRALGGSKMIETAYGLGYAMTAPALAKMTAALQPPEMQDARGG